MPYALNGSFAVSLWMRRLPDSNFSGDAFQYLYSHTGVASVAALSPNQVRSCLSQPLSYLVPFLFGLFLSSLRRLPSRELWLPCFGAGGPLFASFL